MRNTQHTHTIHRHTVTLPEPKVPTTAVHAFRGLQSAPHGERARRKAK